MRCRIYAGKSSFVILKSERNLKTINLTYQRVPAINYHLPQLFNDSDSRSFKIIYNKVNVNFEGCLPHLHKINIKLLFSHSSTYFIFLSGWSKIHWEILWSSLRRFWSKQRMSNNWKGRLKLQNWVAIEGMWNKTGATTCFHKQHRCKVSSRSGDGWGWNYNNCLSVSTTDCSNSSRITSSYVILHTFSLILHF